MLTFHKEKTKPAKKRNYCDDDEVSSDLTSEDNDLEPSNLHAKCTPTCPTRETTKKQSFGSKNVGGRNVSEGKCYVAEPDSADESASDTETGNMLGSIQHNSHAKEADCSNCPAYKRAHIEKQTQKPAALPPVRVNQKPVDADDTLNSMRPVISNVFSLTGPTENGLDNNYVADQERSHTNVGSNYYSTSTAPANNAERTNNSYNKSTGALPSTLAWQQQSPGNLTNNDLCSNCLSQKPNENKCIHCGIIFMDAPMHMIHMLWHGEKHPFQCHSCGKICKDKYSFTTHIFKAQHMNDPH